MLSVRFQFPLELLRGGTYVRLMKKICVLLMLATCWVAKVSGQDAATEERLNRLSGQIEDLIASQRAQAKQLGDISRELQQLRDAIDKPNTSYATVADLNRLAETIKDVDRKRIADAETVQVELKKLAKILTAPATRSQPVTAEKESPKSSLPERYMRHTVAKGETLSSIVAAFREQNVRVTVDQVLKANPGLKPERLGVGQEIIIPAP